MSQLKESSLFGSLLENVEKISQKKRKSSSLGGDNNKNSKYSKTEKDNKKDAPAVSNVAKSSPPLVAVANVTRKVSGILLVERGRELLRGVLTRNWCRLSISRLMLPSG